ncbi:DUF4352 domain-containing protein [Streptococcus cuniculipharyngis]|uniref:DUF4352 domain-containing protein n=1 Tax=Streptococcus cuniculipharyngis TaxID=1562651 RepID=A0A5C5S9P7_9STRE|nr:DUF4352 domain-containing protein [Streptococcus cuniculipharyngis]TWS96700.1 DUF4352 domain-containing protein [Streptococcus cuniculipharyngis]
MKKLGGCLGKIFLGFLLLGLLGMLFGKNAAKTTQPSGTSNQTASQTVASEQGTATPESSTQAETSAEPSYGIGQTVTVGDLDFVVNSRSIESNFGGEFGKTANGVYLTLNVTVTNKGKKAVTVSDSFFKLLQGDVEYSADTSAGIYANNDAKFFWQELNPQSTLTGNVVFDVTEEVANTADLQLQLQANLWGFQKALVNLN